MSSQGGSRSEYLIGKAGTEYITQKLTHEDPRVFLSQFQAAHGIAPHNDTCYTISICLIHSFSAILLALTSAIIWKLEN